MRKYTPLMCKDCPTEIFVDVNMVMIKDELWDSICDDHKDAYCDCCIEKRLGRKIVPADFKGASGGRDIIPCNYMWLHERKNKQINVLIAEVQRHTLDQRLVVGLHVLDVEQFKC